MMEFAATSQTGVAHKVNQDGYRLQRDEDGSYIAIVADGMGGHVAGEVASALAVEAIWQALITEREQDPDERLLRAVQAANAVIFSGRRRIRRVPGWGRRLWW